MSGDSIRAWRSLLLAVLTFLLLGADMASVVFAKILDGRSASDPRLWSTHWYASVGGFVCSIVIWSLWVSVLVAWSRKRSVLGSLISGQAGSRAFEKWTHHALVPWGGIALALSWGAAHLGTHPEGAVVVMLVALVYGVAFVVAKKSAPAILALVFLGFVL